VNLTHVSDQEHRTIRLIEHLFGAVLRIYKLFGCPGFIKIKAYYTIIFE